MLLPDSTSVLTAAHVNTAKLGSVETGKGKQTEGGYTQVAISAASVLPDSTSVLTASHDHKTKLGSAETDRGTLEDESRIKIVNRGYVFAAE